MARSLGIHLRPDGFSYALAEGSAKKWSVSAHGSGGLAPDEPDPGLALSEALGRSLKEAGLGKVDQVVLTVPSVDTVLRELSLPFSDREKIHQVLKFEVESDLYHLDIDEVVCDYLELADDRATATLLVAALPKTQIGAALEVADETGHDPPVVELDLGALAVAVRTVAPDPDLPAGYQAFLYLGSYSSLLMVAGEDGVRAARKIPIGWRELGRGQEGELPGEGAGELPEAEPEMEVHEGAGEDDEPEAPEADEAPEAPLMLFGADATLPARSAFEAVLERAAPELRQAFLRRMVAEVRRGLAALAGVTVSRLHLMGQEVPGLDQALQQRLGYSAERLVLGDDDGDGGADAVAFGAALRGVGLGGSAMNFRQEEYRQTGGLERLEGPLTLMLVGLIAFLLVDSVILFKRTRDVLVGDNEAIYLYAAQEITGLNEAGRDEDPESWFIKGVEGLDIEDLQRVQTLRSRVKKARKDLDEMLGEGDLVHPQSCLEAWRLAFDVLDRELEQQFEGRWMLESIDFSSLQPRGRNSEPYVEVKIELTIFGDDLSATRKFDELLSAFRIQEWSAGDPAYGGEVAAALDGAARTGTIVVKVSTVKALES